MGTCSANPIKIVVGNTSNHNPSGDRRVISVGLPPNINPNKRVTLKAHKPFTASNTPNSQGWYVHRKSAMSTNAQKPPRGGNATKDPAPTNTQMPEMGRRDHNPPYWVKFWVMLLRTMPPVLITSNDMAMV